MEVEAMLASDATTIISTSEHEEKDVDSLLSSKHSINIPPLINDDVDLERRESTDSNFSLRPSYKQK